MPKTWSAEFKTEVVLKAIKEDRLIKDVAEAYGAGSVTVSNWRSEFFENAEKAFSTDKEIKVKDRKNVELNQEAGHGKLWRNKARGILYES